MQPAKFSKTQHVNVINGPYTFAGQIVDIRHREDWNTYEYLVMEDNGRFSPCEWRAETQLSINNLSNTAICSPKKYIKL